MSEEDFNSPGTVAVRPYQAPPQPQTVDPALDSKAMQLETEIRQQNSSIKSILESLKHMESSQLPGMATTLQNLRTSIERVVVADIPNAVKPVEDDVTRVRQKFDKFSGEAQNKLQFLNEKLADASSNIGQVLQRYGDLTTTARTSVAEIDAELQRQRDTLDNATARLHGLEAGMGQADEILRSLRTEIQNLTRAFNEKLSQFQGETVASFGSTSASLGAALKNESKVRQQTMQQIQKQVNDVNRQTTDVVSKMLTFLTTTKNQYQTSLMALSKAAKEGLISCSASSADGFSQLAARMDQFVADSNAQFSTLESDVNSTIQALKNHIVTTSQGLETALSSVSQARLNSEQDIVARYDELKTNLTQQLQQQSERMENLVNQTVTNCTAELDRITGTVKAQLAEVRSQIERVQRLEARLNAVNNAAVATRSQLAEQISQISQRYTELTTSVEKLQNDFRKKVDEVDTRIEFFEAPENRPNYATKKELSDVIQRTQQMFDGRFEEIEQQIGQVFAHISELTLKQPKKPSSSGEPGAEMLSKLVSEQNK